MFGNFASTTYSQTLGGGSNTQHPCSLGRGPRMVKKKYKQPVRSVKFSWSWGISGTKDAQGSGSLSCWPVSIMQCATRPFKKLFMFTVSSYSSVFSGPVTPPEQRFSRSLVTSMLPTPWSFLSSLLLDARLLETPHQLLLLLPFCQFFLTVRLSPSSHLSSLTCLSSSFPFGHGCVYVCGGVSCFWSIAPLTVRLSQASHWILLLILIHPSGDLISIISTVWMLLNLKCLFIDL